MTEHVTLVIEGLAIHLVLQIDPHPLVFCMHVCLHAAPGVARVSGRLSLRTQIWRACTRLTCSCRTLNDNIINWVWVGHAHSYSFADHAMTCSGWYNLRMACWQQPHEPGTITLIKPLDHYGWLNWHSEKIYILQSRHLTARASMLTREVHITAYVRPHAPFLKYDKGKFHQETRDVTLQQGQSNALQVAWLYLIFVYDMPFFSLPLTQYGYNI
jgi:hypothetical protein